jgi:hypothetical protein
MLIESVLRHGDRKLITKGWCFLVDNNQLIDNMVESRPKIVQTLTNNEIQERGGSGDVTGKLNEPEVFRISLADHFAFLQTGLNLAPYSCEMISSSTNLFPDTVERMIHNVKTESNEFVPKLENNTVNKVAQMLKDFNERMTLNNLRLSQRYIDGEIRLILHIRLTDQDYVTVFERASNAAGEPDAPKVSQALKHVERGHFKDGLLERDNRDQQSVVLIGNVQFVDRPEKRVPTLVRMGNIDSIYGALPHALYSSMSLGFVFRGKLPDREGNLLQLTRCKGNSLSDAADFHERPSEVIKSASKVVDNISGHKSNLDQWRVKNSNAIDCLSGLRIMLADDSIWWGFESEEASPKDFQVTDVLVGPFNFYADKRKSFIGSHEGL